MDAHGYFVDMEYEVYQAFQPMNPSAMRFYSAYKGIKAPDFDKPFTYCELGSGQGYGLLMFAALYPNGRFIGIDFSDTQIARARWLAGEMKLDNIEFRQLSFGDFAAQEGELFDVIALHGVWTWVDPSVRGQIVEVLRRRLRPGGFAYVSANMMPGWAQVVPLQRLMLSVKHALPGANPKHQVDIIRQLLEANPLSIKQAPRAQQILSTGFGQSLSYFAHEYFNEAWAPVFFTDLAADLAQAGLSFVASGRPSDANDRFRTTAQQREVLAAMGDVAERENAKDVFTAAAFRSDYFANAPEGMTTAEQLACISATPIGLLDESKAEVGQVTGFGETIAIDTVLRDAIVAAVWDEPRTIGALCSLEAATANGLSATFDAILLMLTAGCLEVGLGAVHDADVRERASRFNEIALMFSRTFDAPLQLAAPVLRAPMVLPLKDRTYLLALVEGRDPIVEILALADKTNAEVTENGKPVTGRSARYKAASVDYGRWRTERMPSLARLGIVGGGTDSKPDSAQKVA